MSEKRASAAPFRVDRRLAQVILLTGLIFLVEVVGGFLSNSLALLSDAGHVFTDLLALGLAWGAARQSLRPATPQMTYGYHRWGVLAALINSLSLLGICGAIFYEAFRRLGHPEPVEGPLMLAVAVAGLVVNLYVLLRLRGLGAENINLRAALWHAGGDALSSMGVILGGALILLTGRYWFDPAISFVIGAIILLGAWRLLREGMNVILEAPPSHLDSREVGRAIAEIAGVGGVHDLHIWSIAPGFSVLSCHLWLEDLPLSQGSLITSQVKEMLEKRFRIRHATLQLECPSCCPSEGTYCSGELPPGREV
jgi:cobalt-zinc-cadmium efflux system protein